ncbi:hypothetical protein D3C72_2062780 [compost metagenome]
MDSGRRVVDPPEVRVVVKELPKRGLVQTRHPLFQLSNRHAVLESSPRFAHDILLVGIRTTPQHR